MARLDRPLYGDYATGAMGRVLDFRHTVNPPDEPGDTVVYFGTVAKLPQSSCPPSPAQAATRALYAAAVAAWNALSDEDQDIYNAAHPTNLSGFNFFLRLFLTPGRAYFDFCVFGQAWFQLAPAPNQPAAVDYASPFPSSIDEFPVIRPGADSPQAWLFNRLFDTIQNIQALLI